jgi:hypothetical protein
VDWRGSFLCLVQSDKIPAVNIENLDKIVRFSFILYSPRFGFFLKHKLKILIVISLILFRFVLCPFGLQLKSYKDNILQLERGCLDVIANMVGASLAVFSVILYFKNRRLSKI